ncbi:hypothetical protein LguiB_013535 [Lonicera macranthoides]
MGSGYRRDPQTRGDARQASANDGNLQYTVERLMESQWRALTGYGRLATSGP